MRITLGLRALGDVVFVLFFGCTFGFKREAFPPKYLLASSMTGLSTPKIELGDNNNRIMQSIANKQHTHRTKNSTDTNDAQEQTTNRKQYLNKQKHSTCNKQINETNKQTSKQASKQTTPKKETNKQPQRKDTKRQQNTKTSTTFQKTQQE